MSIWVRAVCTKSLGEVTPEDLRAGVADRLERLAAFYGEPDPAETLGRLRVERAGHDERAEVFLLHYRPDDDHFLRVERWTEPARVKEETVELMAELEDCDEEGVDDVRACLERAVETTALELKISDAEGIGWPIAIATAATLAALGEGLIQADAEGWMAPRGLAVDHLIDAD